MAGNSTEIFQRVEKKYLLSQKQYQKLQEKMKPYMQVDDYGLSTICNVYYDTQDYDLVRRSNEKPVYKEKLRLRSYGVPDETDKTFVEIKKKWKGVVYKRRIELPLKEARNYLEHGIVPTSPVNPQIRKEIDYFLRLYRPVPKMYIAYDRIAMYGKEDESIRITFDFHIRSREEDVDLSMGDAGRLLMKNDEVLMEIKVGGAYPLWLADMLCEMEIYPTTFSKYGKIYCSGLTAENHMEKQEEKICLPA